MAVFQHLKFYCLKAMFTVLILKTGLNQSCFNLICFQCQIDYTPEQQRKLNFQANRAHDNRKSTKKISTKFCRHQLFCFLPGINPMTLCCRAITTYMKTLQTESWLNHSLWHSLWHSLYNLSQRFKLFKVQKN